MEKFKELIPYGRQQISQDDIREVTKVLKSNFLTQGPEVPLFEETIARYVGAKFCTVANSATSALHLSCLALGIKKNDLVWTSPISYVATANAALYCGAKVEFIDIEEDNFNISPNHLEAQLIKAKKANKLPKAVIVVHMCGQSASMKSIYQLSKKYHFHIIEDASHAIGGEYLSKKIGSCQYSDLCVFSFHPVKIITTGEGGAITTNNQELENKLKRLVSHGVTRLKDYFEHEDDGPWYYEQSDLGYNYRMTEIQAALGRSQFKKLDSFVNKRNSIAKDYYDILNNLPLDMPQVNKDCYSSFHLFVIRLEKGLEHLRRKVFNDLLDNGFGVNVHYIPIYRQPFHRKSLKKGFSLEAAEDYYSRAISIPIYPALNRKDQVRLGEVIKKSLS